jgi:hypothetical protein
MNITRPSPQPSLSQFQPTKLTTFEALHIVKREKTRGNTGRALNLQERTKYTFFLM